MPAPIVPPIAPDPICARHPPLLDKPLRHATGSRGRQLPPGPRGNRGARHAASDLCRREDAAVGVPRRGRCGRLGAGFQVRGGAGGCARRITADKGHAPAAAVRAVCAGALCAGRVAAGRHAAALQDLLGGARPGGRVPACTRRDTVFWLALIACIWGPAQVLHMCGCTCGCWVLAC